MYIIHLVRLESLQALGDNLQQFLGSMKGKDEFLGGMETKTKGNLTSCPKAAAYPGTIIGHFKGKDSLIHFVSDSDLDKVNLLSSGLRSSGDETELITPPARCFQAGQWDG